LETCVFCKIISREIPGEIVLENEHVVAFLDAKPLFLGHVLVAPRAHLVTLPELTDDLITPFFSRVRDVASALPRALGADGTFVAQNNVVSQSVAHLHVHVVPRRKGDGLKGFFWPRMKYASDEARRETAEKIRAELARIALE
jgi:histidine triad (HIT) family protein